MPAALELPAMAVDWASSLLCQQAFDRGAVTRDQPLEVSKPLQLFVGKPALHPAIAEDASVWSCSLAIQ